MATSGEKIFPAGYFDAVPPESTLCVMTPSGRYAVIDGQPVVMPDAKNPYFPWRDRLFVYLNRGISIGSVAVPPYIDTTIVPA